MQNAGVKISGKIVSDEKTMNILRRAAGQEAHARMDTLKRKDGLLGTDWQDGDQTRIVDKDKLKLKDLINLQAGENVTIFNGHPWPAHPCIFRIQKKRPALRSKSTG